jgi:glycosyltransferase involved in cell wall biosynthesis
MIDIIIPAYNAHKTLPNTLSSIAIQTAANLVKVIIVNDGGLSYEKEIEFFRNNLDIKLINTENAGPAIARQIGLESSSNPYIMFIDADDVFSNVFSVATLFFRINENEKAICVNSKFVSELENGDYKVFNNKEFIWLFGNIYRRDFIEKNNIRFPVFSANEDLIFNLEIQIKAMQMDKEIVYLQDPTYIWKFNPNSITRRDEMEYSFFESSYYIIKGKTELFKKFDADVIDRYVFESMWDFYFFWEESIGGRKDRADYHNDIMDACKEFYHTYSHILDGVTDENWKILNSKKVKALNYLKRINFMDFIAIMKKEQ